VNLFGTKNAPKAVQPIKSESSEIESEEDAECLYCRGTLTWVLNKKRIGLVTNSVVNGHTKIVMELKRVMISFAICACNGQY
jgi:hypothetical protein